MYVNRNLCLFLCALVFVGGKWVHSQDVPYNGESRPTHAQPGEVWCLVTLAPDYRTVTEQVMCQPASCTYETIPAKYETRSKQVMCKKESKRCINIPAEYADECYEVLKCPARTEWQRVNCDANVTLNQCEEKGACYGLVTIPTVYETKTRRVCVKPASATYEVIPAEYKTVEEEYCVQAKSKRRIEIPARYETRSKQICVSSGVKVWRLTSCTTSVSSNTDCGPVARYCEIPGSDLKSLMMVRK